MVNIQARKTERKHLNFFLCFALSGIILMLLDTVFNFQTPVWELLYNTSKDLQIFGFCCLAFLLCGYDVLYLKIILFFLSISRFVVLCANLHYIDKQAPASVIIILSTIYLLWAIRLLFARKIKDQKPKPGEAYYIFIPISTVWGLLQAVFLPWYPPLYESRMISNGEHIWFVHHNKFKRSLVSRTDLSRIENKVRIPLGRKLQPQEYSILDSMVGTEAIRGYKDCRKLLIIK